jgi:hypothetical protein
MARRHGLGSDIFQLLFKNTKEIKMETEVKELSINGVTYVPKGSETKPAESFNGMQYAIIRTRSAGVFAGYIKERDGMEATVIKARRLWYWSGAASLSQLAVDGTGKPKECKFPVAVDEILLTEVIEILSVTEKAKKSIESVAVWEA